MKILICVLLMNFALFSQENLNPIKLRYSQTFIDATGLRNYGTVSHTDAYIKKDYDKSKFILGWNWGFYSSKNMDKMFGINTYHHSDIDQSYNMDYTNHNYNNASILYVGDIYGGTNYIKNLVGLGIYLEPSLNVTTSNTFKPNSEADYGSAFGFKNKNLSIGSNTVVSYGSNTYGCFHLSQSSLTVSPTTILSDIYPKHAFTYLGTDNTKGLDISTSSATTNKNGVTWNLSINLRASETFPISDWNDIVLRIKLPYTLEDHSTSTISNSYGYIKFSNLPLSSGTISNDIYSIIPPNRILTLTELNSNTITDFRGYSRSITDSFTNDAHEFIITKGMLTTGTSNSNSFVSLSALFYCDGKVNAIDEFIRNPVFRPVYGSATYTQTLKYITEIDVEVEYYGHSDVDINWVRFETPNLQKISRGYYDENIHFSFLKQLYNQFELNSSSFSLFRIYNDDELLPSQYEQSRYLNLLLDTMVSTEMFYTSVADDPVLNSVPHFLYGTGYKQFWSGTNFTGILKGYHPAPYIRMEASSIDGTHNHPEVFNFESGYLGYPGHFLNSFYSGTLTSLKTSAIELLKDTVNSLYETNFLDISESNKIGIYLNPKPSFSPFNSYKTYEQLALNPRGDYNSRTSVSSIQQLFDKQLYNNFHNIPNLYYNNKHWVNVWLGQTYQTVPSVSNSSGSFFSTITLPFDNNRPVTGEELRLSLGTELVKGVKGFLVWTNYSDKNPNRNSNTFYNLDGTYSTKTFTYFGGIISQASPTSSFSNYAYQDIYSDLLGGDFINTVTSGSITSSTFDPDYYHQFYAPNEILPGGQLSSTFYDFNKLYIKPSRVYTGRKSARTELMKTFNFIKENEDLLLNVDLLAYKNKGFISFSNHNPSTTLTINNFIDTAGITTRPIGRTQDVAYNSGTISIPYYENEARLDPEDMFSPNIDSAFYEVSVLASPSSLTISEPSSSFCVAVVNRRTDPLFQNYYQDSESRTFNEMQFYTTAEFDENCIKSVDTKDIYGEDRSPDWWRIKWWKRLGCREISIPMKIKYKDVGGNEKYALLKVTELKGNEKPLFDYVKASRSYTDEEASGLVYQLYPKLNTVIGQDGIISTNYLPGETKIFQVQILPPGELTGKLDNINQNKMVSMPIYKSSGTITSKIAHYVTYYKKDDAIRHKNVVHLAISKATDKNSNDANITWYAVDIPVSDNIALLGNSTTINNSSSTFYDCIQPSIVVRKDASVHNRHKVYIVYSCTFPQIANNDIISIDESVYNIDFDDATATYTISNVYNKEIDKVYKGDSENDWGTPTVNSSNEVLFYSWSGVPMTTPPLRKAISYSYKLPNTTGIDRLNRIFLDNAIFPYCSSTFTNMLHPSLNTYSNNLSLFNHVNHATLVWDQNMCTDNQIPDRRLIYMTNLYFDPNGGSSSFGHFLPPLEPSSTFKDGMSFYDNEKIVKFNWGGSAGIYPSVYSNLTMVDNNLNTEAVTDYISFERRYVETSRIFFMKIKEFNNTYWDVDPAMFTILSRNWSPYSHYISTSQPSIKQPSTILNNNVSYYSYASRVSLNFKIENSNKEIYQFFLNEGSQIGGDIFNISDVYSNNQFVFNLGLITKDGDQNHLTSSPNINFDPYVWKNRRVFNDYKDTPTIIPSAQYFYKQNRDGLEIEGYCGYNTDTSSFYFGNINFNGSELKMKLPFTLVIDTITGNYNKYNNNNFIASHTFTVGSSAELSFKLYGVSPNICDIYIQRVDSNFKIPLNVSLPNSDSVCNLVRVVLINGQNKNYQLVFEKIDTLGKYEEQIVLGGMGIQDTIYFKSNNSNLKIIDLSGKSTMSGGDDLILSVTPNPAENEVYAVAYIPSSRLIERLIGENKLVVSLYNSIGMLIKEINCISGETIKFDLRELGNGNYFVKAREKIDSFIEECKSVQRNLIIKR